MQADITKTRQTLYSLLNNAAKFTQHGSILLEIRRENSEPGSQPQAPDWITFRITDTGIGMSPETISKLFQPFTQADGSSTRQYGGTGLGLALSRQYCEMMGGTIEVESQLGQGSIFTVRLPAQTYNTSLFQPEAPNSPDDCSSGCPNQSRPLNDNNQATHVTINP